jgi:hypothetical protein
MKNKILKTILPMLLIQGAVAQVGVAIKVDRRQYLEHEPVTAVVTITNRSGRELTFTSRAEGSIAHSWLDFGMRDSSGRAVTKRHHKVFQRAVIPAGRSMARRVILTNMFSIGRTGNYSVTAHVRQPGIDETAYGSNSGHFTVGGGSVLQRTPFGVPNSPAIKREYRVVSFNDGKRTSLYAQVMNLTTGLPISTLRMSDYLTFVKPQIAIDGQNQLHTLYLGNPEIYVETVVNQDGRLMSTKYYKRAGGRRPRFVPFSDGNVVVSGAIPYDPQKEAANQPRPRRSSERPD